MEKLNELPQAFCGVIQSGKVVMLPANDGQWLNKTSVAEAFRALEQRAEAAEAKLAELEKQEAVGHFMLARDEDDSWWYEASEQNDKAIPLFTRAPPAADLAEIVPEDLNGKSMRYIADKFQVSISEAQFILVGFNACRTTILRKIDEVPLFTHPAPAADLAELVPSEITHADAPELQEIASSAQAIGIKGTYAGFAVGFNACRAAILRNIEDAGKKHE